MTRNHVCSFAIAAAFAATPVFAQLPPLPPAAPAAPALPALPAVPAPPERVVIGPDARPPQPPEPPRAPFSEPLQITLPEIAVDGFHLEPFTFAIEPPQFDLNFARIERDVRTFEWDLRTELGWNDALVPAVPLPPSPPGQSVIIAGPGNSLYDQARNMIDRDQYDRALNTLDRLISQGGPRTDGGLYWKAYSLSKLARVTDALTTLSELQKRFPTSSWVREAKFLEAQIRAAAGQSVNADAQANDDLKLLALQGLMQSDPDTTIPTIEKMLAGDASVRVKDRALFVLSRSRSARARDVLAGVAKGGSNPDLQRSAIRYLGRMSGVESAQILEDTYRSTNDVDLKRSIIRSFGESRARDTLLALAKSESSAELRGDAIQQLGMMRAVNELGELYRAESNVDVKRRIQQAMFAAGAIDKLTPIAQSEKDPELRRAAIRHLGVSNSADATATLVSIYNTDTTLETRRAVIDALSMRRSAAALVGLARAEKNPQMKTEIVRRLSSMRAPEAREYMLELLK